jgi:hypothetical protein
VAEFWLPVYSLGHRSAIPSARCRNWLGLPKSVELIKRNIRKVNIFGGVLLIVLGTLMATGLWLQFTNWLQVVNSGIILPL